ncbi:MAG TPA: hypothetical protein VJ022_06550 [Anaerolineales bacterium]|nr:hypothetical protein [Anaerolineales bacterium]
MNKYVILVILVLASAACSPTPVIAPLETPPVSSSSPGVITVTATPQEVIPTVVIQPTVVSMPDTSGSLWLQVLSPLDEAVINTLQVEVTGSASAGAVISIDEEILIVGVDQQFKTTISLDEGPNLIEIIASDENGNEMSVLLTITYEP